jgi:hypothetical protein
VSSTRVLQASPSTQRHSSHANPTAEKQIKHCNDLANMKQIPSVLPYYIPPLDGTVKHENNTHEFEYTLIISNIPKGIRIVGTQLGYRSQL